MALSFIRYHRKERPQECGHRRLERLRNGIVALCTLMMCAAGCGWAPVATRKIAIAAAADLKFAMDEVSLEFQRAHPGVELQTSFGSSGNFYAQIHNGAPFEVFLSADVEYPRKLLREGIGSADSLFVY